MPKASWEKLLADKRVPRKSSGKKKSVTSKLHPEKDMRSPFEQDYDRIVFSYPFRRLARKTQVHPLAKNDHVHNRLTHSIEVSSVGRSFAHRLAELIRSKGDVSAKSDFYNLSMILQSACLIHDIGNPPFGHAGEEVVRAWSQNNIEKLFPTGMSDNESRNDWLNFEGNAQGFRIASRPDNEIAGYMRLTYATLASAVKYPWDSSSPQTLIKNKHNIYSTEKVIFKDMSEELGLARPDHSVARHPISFLVEAADDICYQILDLEDAVGVGICSHDDIRKLFWKVAGSDNDKKWMGIHQIRGQAIKRVMDECWDVFEKQYDSMMNLEDVPDLSSQTTQSCKEILQEMKDQYKTIFADRRKVATELAAYHVLGKILSPMVETARYIIETKGDPNTLPFLSKKCIELTWGMEFVTKNIDQSYTWWLSAIMDYISGLTDNYAVRLSQEIEGTNMVA